PWCRAMDCVRWCGTTTSCRHQRTQSIALHQGPLARRFRVADLVLHTTPGPVVPRLAQATTEVALSLFDEQSARARLARKRQTTEQWLRQVVPGDAVAGTGPVAGPLEVPTPLETPTPQQQEGGQHG
ncbi:PH domain-containing protein, partial [Pseudarthrobacter sp. NKDBFgelt]|uniref:PH domain-containing protein n=1 Tax=Pseudarthrobacter sp. NKDBFgelt TaxID=3384443 RepID=UPI0038D462C0